MKREQGVKKSGIALLLVLSLLLAFWIPARAGSSYSKEEMERSLAIFPGKIWQKTQTPLLGKI